MAHEQSDDVQSQRKRLQAHLGADTYQQLLYSVAPTRKRQRLLFWQEDLFRRSEAPTGVIVHSIDDFLRLFADVERTPHRPASLSAEELAELAQYDEELALSSDAAMRDAHSLRQQALQAASEAQRLIELGQPSNAQESIRQAFDFQRQAAERCKDVGSEYATARSEHSRDAAKLALECGDFREAVRLVWQAKQRLPPDLDRQLDELDQQAEALRQRTIGARLQEVSISAVPLGQSAAFAFSPDSRCLLSLIGDASVRIHDLESESLRQEIRVPIEVAKNAFQSSAHLRGICSTPDNQSIVLAGAEGSVVVWDRAAQQIRMKLAAHTYQVMQVAVSPDGKWLASCGAFGVKLWDAMSGKKRGSFEKQPKNIFVVKFSPDSKQLAWSDENGRVTLLDIVTRNVIFSFKPHKGDVFDLAFSPCSQFLAITGRDVKLLATADGRETMSFITGERSYAVAFSPDGRLLATTDKDLLLLWDVQARECIQAIPDTRWYDSVKFSPDGKRLAASVFPQGIRMWSVQHLLDVEHDLSELHGKAGTVIVPSNSRPPAMLAQAVTTPVPAKMPPPAHLLKCTEPISSRCRRNRYVGNVRCSCGDKKFRLQHAGASREFKGEKYPQDTKVGDAYFMIIKATCLECATEYLLFDKDFHGWNGFVVDSGERLPRPELVSWPCTACGESRHEVTIGVYSEGRQDAIDESGELLNENNWQEGFGSINIDVKCSACGHKVNGWLAYETM